MVYLHAVTGNVIMMMIIMMIMMIMMIMIMLLLLNLRLQWRRLMLDRMIEHDVAQPAVDGDDDDANGGDGRISASRGIGSSSTASFGSSSTAVDSAARDVQYIVDSIAGALQAKPIYKNPKPKIQNPNHATQNPKPKIQNPKPKASNPQL